MVGVTYAAVPLYRMFCQVRWAYLLRIWFCIAAPKCWAQLHADSPRA